MRKLLLPSLLALATLTNIAPARSAVPEAATVQAPLSQGEQDAVRMVDAFMAALVSGQLEAARQFMTPDAVVIANGNVLGERDGYIDGAAAADAAALRTVERDVLRRSVRADGDSAWVLSEKRVHAPGDASGRSEVVFETMVLAKTSEGWKIAHIHWSGRHAG